MLLPIGVLSYNAYILSHTLWTHSNLLSSLYITQKDNKINPTRDLGEITLPFNMRNY